MSAYLCDDDHLSALAAYAVQFALIRRSSLNPLLSYDLAEATRGKSDAETIALVLHHENAAAVDETPAFTFAADAARPVHEGRVSAVEIIKSAKCYVYQASESKTWKGSLAKHIVDEIITTAIENLPGYEEACWGAPVSRAAVKAVAR